MILGQGVLDQRPVKKRPSKSSRSVSLTQDQRDCIAKFNECCLKLSLSKNAVRKLGGFTPARAPGIVTQEKILFTVNKLWRAYQGDQKPRVADLKFACRKCLALIQPEYKKPLGKPWKETIRGVLRDIQSNNWWWTKFPPGDQGYFRRKILKILVDQEAFQAYGRHRGRVYRIGPLLADNPEVCQDLLIAPPTQEDIVNQIESLNLESVIAPSVENATPSDRVLEPLPSIEDRIDLHLSQVNDLLRDPDLTADVTIRLRKLKRSLLKTQLQVFKP